jgi:serine/threonine protein phosphatase PrpC
MTKPESPPPTPGEPAHVEIAGLTDVGQVREHNEDAFLIAGLGEKAVDRSETGFVGPLPAAGLLFAVADGMGGAASGEVASRLAVETLRDQLRDGYAADADRETLARGLEGALETANEKIFAEASQESKHRGMGTTMTAVLASGDRLCISQVGDSRAYLLRKGEIVQLTEDQSLINQLIRDGTLTDEEAEKIGGKNIILQALGVEEAIQADTRHLEVLSGDILLVCSDGLSGMMSDPDMAATLLEIQDPAEACRKLVEQANAAGGRDNISVIVARFTGGSLRAPAEGTADLVVHAGKPPETKSPSRKKLLILLAVVAAAILFGLLLFTGGNGGGPPRLDLQFEVGGVVGELVPVGGGDPIRFELKAHEKTYTVEDVEPGDYEITVRRKGYRDTTQKFTVDERGSTVPISLTALSRKIVVTTKPEGGAEVRLLTPEGEEIVKTSPATFFRDPGEYRIEVRKKGYKTVREVVTLTADEDVWLDLTIVPHTGTVRFIGVVPGTTAIVTRDGEAFLEKEVPANDLLELPEGIYEIELRAALYVPWSRSGVSVVGEKFTRVEVKQVFKKGLILVTISAAKKAAGVSDVTVKGPEDYFKGQRLIEPEDDGSYRAPFLVPPGEYQVQAGTDKRSVAVEAGGTHKVAFE